MQNIYKTKIWCSCYFISRAVSSNEGKQVGLDGLLQGSIEYCVDRSSKVDVASLAKEVKSSMSGIKDCYSQIGQ